LFRQLATFHLVAIGWVLFRAHDWVGVKRLFSGLFVWGDSAAVFRTAPFALLLIAGFHVLHRFDRMSLICRAVRRLPPPVSYGGAATLIAAAAAFSVGNPSAFIYFDF
jgi:hypothetical protein